FIDFNDWFNNTAAAGGSIVATSIWNQQPDNPTPHDASLYGYTVDTGATNPKTIISMTVPDDQRLKLFSAAVHS
ncbi:MAG TPA: hypothetical protein VHV74_07715, partial [Pseudonocardiaceae bacterium]|nr:hypothetical protein [Pseudonocardiaceae bacterium]